MIGSDQVVNPDYVIHGLEQIKAIRTWKSSIISRSQGDFPMSTMVEKTTTSLIVSTTFTFLILSTQKSNRKLIL
ncbi:unnamed protein product [Caenorhabditis nigoni]